MATKQERREYAQALRKMARFVEYDRTLPLPSDWGRSIAVTVEAPDKAAVTKATRALKGRRMGRSITKEFSASSLVLTRDFGASVRFQVYLPREAVCRKVVVEREFIRCDQDDDLVVNEEGQKGYYRDKTVWDCSDASLLR